MSEEFSDFQNFTNWHTKQVGYNAIGYHLDKDILVHDNKLYSKETCVLIPQELNSFFKRNPDRGSLPVGVTKRKDKPAYEVYLSVNGKKRYVGSSTDMLTAAYLYETAKKSELLRWYDRLLGQEFVVDGRVIEAIRIRCL